MAIKYSIIENPLKKGVYIPKVIHDSTLDISALSDNIVSKTSFSEGTVQAVISALREEIINALLHSDSVNIDNLVTVSLSLRGTFDDPNVQINANNAELFVNTRISSTINNTVRSKARFSRVTQVPKNPSFTSIQSVAQSLTDYYMPNAPLRITGNNLKFNTKKNDEGIDCIKTDNTSYHVPFYSVVSHKRIDFMIPDNLGDITLQIAIRYGTSPEIQTKKYKETLKVMIATAFEDTVIVRNYTGNAGTASLTVNKNNGSLSYHAQGDTAGSFIPISEEGTYTLVSGTSSNAITIDIIDYDAYQEAFTQAESVTVEITL